MPPLNQSVFFAAFHRDQVKGVEQRQKKRGGMKRFLTRSSGPNDPDWRGRL